MTVDFYDIPGGPELPSAGDTTGVWYVGVNLVITARGVRPGLFDETDSPPVGCIIRSSNDGMPYWIKEDGSVHPMFRAPEASP